ncbi:MAG: hypothetical protein KGL39_08515 [Patescibacteria group bacterium]|nr:hypothetical protein [Patescibacteria group bacterium]
MSNQIKIEPGMNANEKAIRALSPCAEGLSFAESCGFDPRRMWDTCLRADWLVWWLRRAKRATPEQLVKVSVALAREVLPIFESRFPKDKRPRRALEAAQSGSLTAADVNDAWCAARAAYGAAAYAAYAVDAVAYAAYADAVAYAVDADGADIAYFALVAFVTDGLDTATAQHRLADVVRRTIQCPF